MNDNMLETIPDMMNELKALKAFQDSEDGLLRQAPIFPLIFNGDIQAFVVANFRITASMGVNAFAELYIDQTMLSTNLSFAIYRETSSTWILRVTGFNDYSGDIAVNIVSTGNVETASGVQL